MRRVAIALLFSSLIPPPGGALLAQISVDPAFQCEALLTILPMAGAGTASGPNRSLFALLPGKRPAISELAHPISDDGQATLMRPWAGNRADVKVFEQGKATLDEVQTEFRMVRAGSGVRRFAGGVR